MKKTITLDQVSGTEVSIQGSLAGAPPECTWAGELGQAPQQDVVQRWVLHLASYAGAVVSGLVPNYLEGATLRNGLGLSQLRRLVQLGRAKYIIRCGIPAL